MLIRASPRSLALALALVAVACAAPGEPRAAGELLLESAVLSGGPLRLRLYLPDGGGAGRPFFVDDALVAHGSPLLREAGTLDGAGRAALRCVPGCTAVLDSISGCVTVTADGVVYYNPWGGDVPRPLEGTIDVCPVDGEPVVRRTTLQPPADDPGASAPLSALALSTNVPLDEGTLASVRIVRAGEDVPFRYEGDAFGGQLLLDVPVDPEGPIDVDATGVRDVLGRPVDTTAHVVVTTDVLSDLSLDTAPPAGAMASFGAELAIASGALVATDAGHWPRTRPFVALLALGDPGPATAVRVQGQQELRYNGQLRAYVARAGGLPISVIRLPFGAVDVDVPVPPGTGPIWLVVYSDQLIPQPMDYAPASFLRIDELTLVAP